MSTRIENVVCFGDSIAYGFGTETRVGWAELLRRHFYRLNHQIRDQHACFFDQTIPGESSESLRDRIAWATDHKSGAQSTRSLLYRLTRSNLTVISIGGQDLYSNLRANRDPYDALASFVRAVGDMASRVADMGAILYIGPPAPKKEVAEHRVFGYNTTVGEFMNKYQIAAENAIAGEALMAGKQFSTVRLFEATMDHPDYRLGPDRNHPTEAGHQLIFDIIRPKFDTMVGVYYEV